MDGVSQEEVVGRIDQDFVQVFHLLVSRFTPLIPKLLTSFLFRR